MQVRARIPKVDTNVIEPPSVCPYEGCDGHYFKDHQKACVKPIRDTRIEQVTASRRKCLTCGRTHRVYPQGVSSASQSGRLKGLSILLWVLGISYRGVAGVLAGLGCRIHYTTVYDNVRAAGKKVRQLRETWLTAEGKVSVVGGDLTYLKCKGERIAIAIAVDDATGVVLDIEVLENEETETLTEWLEPLLDMVGAEVLITDDQDGFKSVADESGVSHQICRQHVTRNVLDFVAKTAKGVLKSPPRVPTGSDLSADQLLDDLALLEWIMLGQPSHAVKLLEELYHRYADVPSPKKGQRASPWYRMRNHVLRLWNHWTRYTCVNSLAAKGKPGINETNNTTERVIGWGIKERYRTVRGYKDQDSVLDVAHLTTWLQEGAEDREMEVLFK